LGKLADIVRRSLGVGGANLKDNCQLFSLCFSLQLNMTNERRHRIESVLAHRQNDLTIVLENVFDPHNISAVMRSCDAIGIQEIYVLNTKIPRHKKWGARSSSSAAKWLTIHQFESTEECFNILRKKYESILTTHLSGDAVSLYQLDLAKSTALIFGNEHAGVSEELRLLADGNFIIPQVGMIQSLNISVACAVSLYEAFRQKTEAGHYQQQKLTTEEYRSLTNQWGLYNEEINS
jgi:tRNA (guanosine-2'-O-)-methyltransferase